MSPDIREPRMRYVVRVPFPDSDLYCFVLDNQGKIHYYEKEEVAMSVAKELNGVVIESRYYGL